MINEITVTQTLAKSHNGFVKLSGSGSVIYADTLPIPTPDLNGRDGWLYSKTSGAEKFNYYIYSQGSHAIPLNQLSTVFFQGAVDNYISNASVPFVVVYTKPTGSGDAGAWYHSKITYSMNATVLNNIQLGESCFFRCIEKPKNILNNNREVILGIKTVTGDGVGTEEILTIAIHSDSAAANTTQILIQSAGYQTINEIVNRNIKFIS